jgi:hypothetical protein
MPPDRQTRDNGRPEEWMGMAINTAIATRSFQR